MYKLASTLFAITCVMSLQAEESKPLWELGVGLAGINIPDYRGARHRRNYLLPLPYLIYRGERLKVNRDGLRGLLYQSEGVRLDISIDGGVPVESDDNAIRRGMPDLKPMFEIGPSLKVLLAQNVVGTDKLSLILPLRAAFAADFTQIDHEGWLFHPQLGLDISATRNLKFGIAIGPLYANQDYHDYYYSVAPQYATSARSTYTAKHGYSGTRLAMTVSWQLKRLRFGAFLRYDNLQGSAFDDSPLLEQEYSFMAGFAIGWVLARSQRTVLVAIDN
jgi:outer membrane protein